MATVTQVFLPQSAILPSSGYPTHDIIQGSNYPVYALDFDGSNITESAFFVFKAVNYGSGNLTVDIDWYADTANSGNVKWGATIAAITPNTDTQDIETDGLATEVTTTQSHLGTTGQRLHRASITVNSLDSIAANDLVILRIRRLAAETANDTMAGDAQVVLISVGYSDT